MNEILQKLGLNPGNSVVIGSGILQALGIRKSKDIDLVVTQEAYNILKKSKKFDIKENHGRKILTNDLFEIGVEWYVLEKLYKFKDFLNDSIIIKDVRYITLDFLYRAKKGWLSQTDVRQKDIDDVKLMKQYLDKHK